MTNAITFLKTHYAKSLIKFISILTFTSMNSIYYFRTERLWKSSVKNRELNKKNAQNEQKCRFLLIDLKHSADFLMSRF